LLVFLKKETVPLQVTPFPKYPSLHLHKKLPTVSVHFAFGEHPPLFVKHSFMSIYLLIIFRFLFWRFKEK